MGANRINNKNNVNDNMSLTRSTLSSHNNISGYNYNNPNINANININSYNTKVKKNTNKHFSNSNISSLDLGSPNTISIESPMTLTQSNVTIESSQNLTAITLQGVNQAGPCGFTLFNKIYS